MIPDVFLHLEPVAHPNRCLQGAGQGGISYCFPPEGVDVSCSLRWRLVHAVAFVIRVFFEIAIEDR